VIESRVGKLFFSAVIADWLVTEKADPIFLRTPFA
jgi:hypothetical protein